MVSWSVASLGPPPLAYCLCPVRSCSPGHEWGHGWLETHWNLSGPSMVRHGACVIICLLLVVSVTSACSSWTVCLGPGGPVMASLGGSGTQRHVPPSAKLSVLANHTRWPQNSRRVGFWGQLGLHVHLIVELVFLPSQAAPTFWLGVGSSQPCEGWHVVPEMRLTSSLLCARTVPRTMLLHLARMWRVSCLVRLSSRLSAPPALRGPSMLFLCLPHPLHGSHPHSCPRG